MIWSSSPARSYPQSALRCPFTPLACLATCPRCPPSWHCSGGRSLITTCGKCQAKLVWNCCKRRDRRSTRTRSTCDTSPSWLSPCASPPSSSRCSTAASSSSSDTHRHRIAFYRFTIRYGSVSMWSYHLSPGHRAPVQVGRREAKGAGLPEGKEFVDQSCTTRW